MVGLILFHGIEIVTTKIVNSKVWGNLSSTSVDDERPQNVIQIEALQFCLGFKFIQERNQDIWFFRYWMTCYNYIVCGCQVWEYYNDNDWKEFCVGSLDFMKSRVLFCFVFLTHCTALVYQQPETFETLIWLQLFHWIRQLHPVAPLRLLGSSWFHVDFT